MNCLASSDESLDKVILPSTLQLGPAAVDDQLGEPLRPVFLFQLLFGEEVSELGGDLELGDQERGHVVRPDLLDEGVCRRIGVLRLGLPGGDVVLEQIDQSGVLQILQLLLGEGHGYWKRTIRAVHAALANTATRSAANSTTIASYRPEEPPSIIHARLVATVTRLRPKVPSNAAPAARKGRTTCSGTAPA